MKYSLLVVYLLSVSSIFKPVSSQSFDIYAEIDIKYQLSVAQKRDYIENSDFDNTLTKYALDFESEFESDLNTLASNCSLEVICSFFSDGVVGQAVIGLNFNADTLLGCINQVFTLLYDGALLPSFSVLDGSSAALNVCNNWSNDSTGVYNCSDDALCSTSISSSTTISSLVSSTLSTDSTTTSTAISSTESSASSTIPTVSSGVSSGVSSSIFSSESSSISRSSISSEVSSIVSSSVSNSATTGLSSSEASSASSGASSSDSTSLTASVSSLNTGGDLTLEVSTEFSAASTSSSTISTIESSITIVSSQPSNIISSNPSIVPSSTTSAPNTTSIIPSSTGVVRVISVISDSDSGSGSIIQSNTIDTGTITTTPSGVISSSLPISSISGSDLITVSGSSTILSSIIETESNSTSTSTFTSTEVSSTGVSNTESISIPSSSFITSTIESNLPSSSDLTGTTLASTSSLPLSSTSISLNSESDITTSPSSSLSLTTPTPNPSSTFITPSIQPSSSAIISIPTESILPSTEESLQSNTPVISSTPGAILISTTISSSLNSISNGVTLPPAPITTTPTTPTLPITTDTINDDLSAIAQANEIFFAALAGLTATAPDVQPAFENLENAIQKFISDLSSFASNSLVKRAPSANDQLVNDFGTQGVQQITSSVSEINNAQNGLVQSNLANNATNNLQQLINNANQMITQFGSDCQNSALNDQISQANSIWATSFSPVPVPSTCSGSQGVSSTSPVVSMSPTKALVITTSSEPNGKISTFLLPTVVAVSTSLTTTPAINSIETPIGKNSELPSFTSATIESIIPIVLTSSALLPSEILPGVTSTSASIVNTFSISNEQSILQVGATQSTLLQQVTLASSLQETVLSQTTLQLSSSPIEAPTPGPQAPQPIAQISAPSQPLPTQNSSSASTISRVSGIFTLLAIGIAILV